MGAYILRRLLQTIPVLWILSIVVFTVFRLLPGDAALLEVGLGGTREEVQVARQRLGLDKPIYVQYGEWLGKVMRGDFGLSLGKTQPVLEVVAKAFIPTLELAVVSLLLSLLISVPLGVLSATRRNSWVDYLVRFLTLIGFSIPGFWLALLLIMVFSVGLGVLPVAGYQPLWEDPVSNLQHIALPAAALTVQLAAVQTRYLRAGVLDVLNHDYVRTARSKGLSEDAVMYGHVLRNALLNFVTVAGLQLAGLLAGSVLIEQIFSWPGLGWLALQAIQTREYDMVQAVTLVIAVCFVFLNLAVDILYAVLSPTIRYGK
jgi:peptide/nickel transport system permease protein